MAPASTAARWVENGDCKAQDQPCEDEAEPQIIKQLKTKGIKNSLTLGHSSPVWIYNSSPITSVPQRVWNLSCMYQAASLPSSKVWIQNSLLSCLSTAAHLTVWAGGYGSHVFPQKDPPYHHTYVLPWWCSPPSLMQIHQGKERTLVVNGQYQHKKNWAHE